MRAFSKLIVSFHVTLLRVICYGNFPIYQKFYSTMRSMLKLVAFIFLSLSLVLCFVFILLLPMSSSSSLMLSLVVFSLSSAFYGAGRLCIKAYVLHCSKRIHRLLRELFMITTAHSWINIGRVLSFSIGKRNRMCLCVLCISLQK